MSQTREITSFSRIEFLAQDFSPEARGTKLLTDDLTGNLSAKDRAMLAYSYFREEAECRVREDQVTGGFDNVVTVRVFKGEDGYTYQYVTKVKPAVLFAERARKVREAQAAVQAKILLENARKLKAEAERKARDPKILAAKQKARDEARAKFLTSPQGKDAAFAAAFQQRAEAARARFRESVKIETKVDVTKAARS